MIPNTIIRSLPAVVYHPCRKRGVIAAAIDLSSAIVERVDAVFADVDVPQHPGAALLVIDHDEIVYRKCYGLADLETQRPVTADSSFYLASICE
jgi:CubicO group peptidase (beta-lactamase class C family)